MNSSTEPNNDAIGSIYNMNDEVTTNDLDNVVACLNYNNDHEDMESNIGLHHDDEEQNIMLTRIIKYSINKYFLIYKLLVNTIPNVIHENNECSNRFFKQRMNWEQHIAELIGSNNFTRTYRMDIDSFMKLVTLVSPYIKYNMMYTKRSTSLGPYYREIIIHCMIRWLAGGSTWTLYVLLVLVAQNSIT